MGHLYTFWSGHSSLYYLVRAPPHRMIAQLEDKDFEIDLSELKESDKIATLVATNCSPMNHGFVFLKKSL